MIISPARLGIRAEPCRRKIRRSREHDPSLVTTAAGAFSGAPEANSIKEDVLQCPPEIERNRFVRILDNVQLDAASG